VTGDRCPVSADGFVFQDNHVPVRLFAAIVAPVKITAERRRRVVTADPLRAAGQQERSDPFVEQSLVVELIVVIVKLPKLGCRVLELEHETMAAASAVAVVDGGRAVQHARRELILFGVQPFQFERNEPAVRPERSGRRHIRQRFVHLRRHRVRPLLHEQSRGQCGTGRTVHRNVRIAKIFTGQLQSDL